MIVISIFELAIALMGIIIGSVIAGWALAGIRLDKVTRERDAAWRQIARMKKNG